MITFCDGSHGSEPQCLEALRAAGLPVNRFFKFDNSTLMEAAADNRTKCSWDMNMKSLDCFLHHISEENSEEPLQIAEPSTPPVEHLQH